MDWNAFWLAAWPVIKDIALGALSLTTTIYVARIGYLKWIAGHAMKDRSSLHQETREDIIEERVDRNTTIRVLKQLLSEERKGRQEDQHNCNARITKLEDDLTKFRTDVLEAVNVAERCSGMVEELTRHRNYYRERAQEASARNVRIHMELVNLKHRLGEAMTTSTMDLLIEPVLDPPPLHDSRGDHHG